MVSLIMFPLSIGLAAVAPSVVDTFFDPQWSNVGPMLLSSRGALRRAATGHHLWLVFLRDWSARRRAPARVGHAGRPHRGTRHRRARRHSLRMCVRRCRVRPAYVGGNVDGRRQDGVRMSAFLLPMTGPLAACFAMAAGVSAARLALVGLTPPIQLLVEIALGAVIYVGGALLIARSSCNELAPYSPLGARDSSMSSRAPSTRRRSLLESSVSAPSFRIHRSQGRVCSSTRVSTAIRSRACLLVVAPVASLDYANPERDLFAARRIPRRAARGSHYASCILGGCIRHTADGRTPSFCLHGCFRCCQAPSAARLRRHRRAFRAS